MVLNYLDWQLDAAGYRFARYADDLVILCKNASQAENALALTVKVLADLGLECSPEKTKISTYKDGFLFLGFDVNSKVVSIRQKSREKFEEKLKELTKRSHNFDAKVIEKLNQVIRGTVNYFCTGFSKVERYFQEIDKWLRRRLRSMKYKRISRKDNARYKNTLFIKRGLLRCKVLCKHVISCWYSLQRSRKAG